MSMLEITTGDFRFLARFEEELAPQTVAAFRRILPFEDRIIHCRWSGESNWIPWGDRELGIGPENATSYPHPGELALYPGGQSETELLFPYGYCSFASKAGHLWANHFATLVEGQEQLKELGRRTLWEGAQAITFRANLRLYRAWAAEPVGRRREIVDGAPATPPVFDGCTASGSFAVLATYGKPSAAGAPNRKRAARDDTSTTIVIATYGSAWKSSGAIVTPRACSANGSP